MYTGTVTCHMDIEVFDNEPIDLDWMTGTIYDNNYCSIMNSFPLVDCESCNPMINFDAPKMYPDPASFPSQHEYLCFYK